ncbi:MAG TPA: RNA 2',3'-cyclic phosphodiesterase [Candidatus Aenigmarchaeota archaeon]|nr:RNA 2',3'-cyclic phosphodiesterase [Candidatus Aenigmarchaeota archaeon]
MRCFIAINLPNEIKKEIWKISKKIPEEGIKKVTEENLHITLKFLGEVDNNQIEKIKYNLKEIKFNKFCVKLTGIGFFPNKNFIRVVWVSVGEGKEEIKKLQKMIDEKLLRLKFNKEKIFEPHLTIARIKFLKNKEFLKELEKIKFNYTLEVESFELMHSILQKKGPIYKKIESFDLI